MMYRAMEIDTTEPGQGQAEGLESLHNGVHITTAFGIRKPAEELYSFWRDFENLPRIMTHLESVRVIDDRRSHWVAKASSLGGKRYVVWTAATDACCAPFSIPAWTPARNASRAFFYGCGATVFASSRRN